jgi:hypothetical protein
MADSWDLKSVDTTMAVLDQALMLYSLIGINSWTRWRLQPVTNVSKS